MIPSGEPARGAPAPSNPYPVHRSSAPATWQPEEHRRPPSRPLLQSPAMVKWLFASLALLAVLVLAVAVPHGAKAPARPAARGDVVLITIDTLRADAPGFA